MPKLQQGPWFWRSAIVWYMIAAVVLAADLLSKAWAVDTFPFGVPQQVTSFFDWLLLYNHGAAFSFLSDQGGWQRWFFGLIAGGVSVALIIWLARLKPTARWESMALALVLAGALGNLYDRVTLGYVVDFISVHYQQHRWPSFNIADSAICAGAAMLIVDMFRQPSSNKESDS